jgi:hypothetical protein
MAVASRAGRPNSKTSRGSIGSGRGVRPARRSSQFQEALSQFALVQPAAAALLQKARQRRDSKEDTPARRANSTAQAVHRMSTSNPFADAPVGIRGADPFPGGTPGGTPPTGMRGDGPILPPPSLSPRQSSGGLPPMNMPRRPDGPRMPPRPVGFAGRSPPGAMSQNLPRVKGMPPRPSMSLGGRPGQPARLPSLGGLPPQRTSMGGGGLPPPRMSSSGNAMPMMRPKMAMPPRPTAMPPRQTGPTN